MGEEEAETGVDDGLDRGHGGIADAVAGAVAGAGVLGTVVASSRPSVKSRDPAAAAAAVPVVAGGMRPRCDVVAGNKA